MTQRNDQKETGRPEKAPRKEGGVPPEHAGNKPRLTDEQAHAELRRLQRERQH